MRIPLLFVLFGLPSCATVYEECVGYEGESYATCQDIAEEYARVTYLEEVFKPSLAVCKARNGHSQWNLRGPQSIAMRMAIKKGQYGNLSRLDMSQWSCCVGAGVCGLY